MKFFQVKRIKFAWNISLANVQKKFWTVKSSWKFKDFSNKFAFGVVKYSEWWYFKEQTQQAEEWSSGLRQRSWKPPRGNSPRVRIPLLPPFFLQKCGIAWMKWRQSRKSIFERQKNGGMKPSGFASWHAVPLHASQDALHILRHCRKMLHKKRLTMKHCFATAPQYEAASFHSAMKHSLRSYDEKMKNESFRLQ